MSARRLRRRPTTGPASPFSFRKAAQNPAQRELIIPFSGTGYVALHEVVSPTKVVVLAVRLQREEDYH